MTTERILISLILVLIIGSNIRDHGECSYEQENFIIFNIAMSVAGLAFIALSTIGG